MKTSHYNYKAHKGAQPVRVLYENLFHWFKNTYPEFKTEELDKAIKNLGLNEDINVIDREDKVAMPAGVGTFKILTIQETFLSYLWCISYSLVFIYDKSIHEQKINKDFVFTDELKLKIKNAHLLFDYGISLLDRFNPWDIENLPNPELYDRLDDDYIEKANGVYINAVNFILLHELAHVVLGHVDTDIENEEKKIKTTDEEILKGEYKADNFAFEKILKGANNLTNSRTVAAGIVAGLCSFLFFSNNMKGGDHPDPDERLKIALDKLNLQPEDNLWGISCLAFKLWTMKTGVELNWPPIVNTYQELFNLTISKMNEHKGQTTK
ncbi:MAG TPA: phage exclusion protein Lit family protein [Leadbetterella sp.]|nr:phage exclusion protein Lit family protein [Leadbetterella sp.]